MKPRAVAVLKSSRGYEVIVADMVNPGHVAAIVESCDEANLICNRLAWHHRARPVPLDEERESHLESLVGKVLKAVGAS